MLNVKLNAIESKIKAIIRFESRITNKQQKESLSFFSLFDERSFLCC